MGSALDPRGLHASASRDSPRDSPQQRLQRLLAVPGSEPYRLNDLLLLRPEADDGLADSDSKETCRDRHVVFFHGDIQNFQEEMALQPDGSQWLRWSLEQVAFILGRRFPGRYVWVVRASHMYLHKFSCYHNFVESNMFGAPEHSANYGAFRHLRALLSHGMERAHLPNPLQPPGGADGAPPDFWLTLVGFSKGCVVLNQLVHELAGALAQPQTGRLAQALSDMFWLDGGHPGGSGTWVTDQRALGALASSGVHVHAHVTPYEVRDPMRAWVGQEYASFVESLRELGARLTTELHFESRPASIENHFRVIEEF